jgi:hypothetical protein
MPALRPRILFPQNDIDFKHTNVQQACQDGPSIRTTEVTSEPVELQFFELVILYFPNADCGYVVVNSAMGPSVVFTYMLECVCGNYIVF